MKEKQLYFENPYVFGKNQKRQILLPDLIELSKLHYEHCAEYRNVLDAMNKSALWNISDFDSIPFLPVQLFKILDLKSIQDVDVFKTLTSSGTTNGTRSKIFLDKKSASCQTSALNAVMKSNISTKRLPMIIVDTDDVIINRKQFSARGAAIVGFSTFGRNHLYLLDKDFRIKWDELTSFIEKHLQDNILMFGFTFIVWEYFANAKNKLSKSLDLSNVKLLHGGGWKKLADQAVDDDCFRNTLKAEFNIDYIYNYYGMVEQIGSIFIQCEYQRLHTPAFTEVLIRDPVSLKIVKPGGIGLIQVLSVLPESYPGHSILTEDLGVITGEDNCPCGRLGKTLRVEGRLKGVEIRGCSDTRKIAVK